MHVGACVSLSTCISRIGVDESRYMQICAHACVCVGHLGIDVGKHVLHVCRYTVFWSRAKRAHPWMGMCMCVCMCVCTCVGIYLLLVACEEGDELSVGDPTVGFLVACFEHPVDRFIHAVLAL